MIGLTLLTGGAAQFGWAAGLGAGGVSVLLLEWERRTQHIAGGDE